MGCGKSTIGKELEREKALHLVDTDSLIEEREGCPITELFKLKGEDYFRQRETELLQELVASKRTGQIISTGGGTIIRPENREILKDLGFIVWLNASLDTLFSRISFCGNRPLLQTKDPRATLEGILKERIPMYRELADLTIDTDNLHISEISYGILESAKLFTGRE